MRTYGAIRDVHDVRDPLYRASRTGVPDYIDLREFDGPIKDQANKGSCTGHGWSECGEFIDRKYKHKETIYSPDWLYTRALQREGSYPNDNGAMPRTGAVIINEEGLCEESVIPYNPDRVVALPPEAAANAARHHQNLARKRIVNLDSLLSCLADGTPWPATVSFQVPASFESQKVADTGVMPAPHKGERIVGGHCTKASGYDIGITPKIRPAGSGPSVLIQNSWGKLWGDHGYVWLALELVDDPRTDIWMVHLGLPWQPKV